jgi:hypothetical protein
MPVTERGIAAVAHKITAIANMPITLWPWGVRPSGVGRITIRKRTSREKTISTRLLRDVPFGLMGKT